MRCSSSIASLLWLIILPHGLFGCDGGAGAGAPSRGRSAVPAERATHAATSDPESPQRDPGEGPGRGSREAVVVEPETPKAAAPPAPPATSGPAGEKGDGKACLAEGCHAGLARQPRIHRPVALGACRLCHRAEGPPEDHVFRLTREDEELCSYCHSSARSGKYRHAPYAEHHCTGCHDPHGSAGKHLLVGDTVGETCEPCHRRERQGFAHSPMARGDCLVCHEAHESGEPHLLRFPEQELCLGECHESLVAGVADAESLHGVFENRRCSSCHATHASDFEHLLIERQRELCLRCHDREIEARPGRFIADIQEQITSAKSIHAPIRDGNCAACHHPHFSRHRTLLRGNFPQESYAAFSGSTYEICFSCHEESNYTQERTTATGFRDGDRNLHHLHVTGKKGRVCTLCHEPHGSHDAKLVRRSVPYGRGAWRLPIDFVRTDSGGSCGSGCHESVSYDRTLEREDP